MIYRLPFIVYGNWSPVPTESGVYFVLGDDEILYIGESANIYERLISHEKQNEFEANGARRVYWLMVEGRAERKSAEQKYIKALTPVLNVRRFDVKKVVVSARIKPYLRDAVREIAAVESRTESQIVERALREWAESLDGEVVT